jgi:hypothetical protein
MPIEMALWRLKGNKGLPVASSSLDLEKRLEDVLADDISILGLDRLLVVGRQNARTSRSAFVQRRSMLQASLLAMSSGRRTRTWCIRPTPFLAESSMPSAASSGVTNSGTHLRRQTHSRSFKSVTGRKTFGTSRPATKHGRSGVPGRSGRQATLRRES